MRDQSSLGGFASLNGHQVAVTKPPVAQHPLAGAQRHRRREQRAVEHERQRTQAIVLRDLASCTTEGKLQIADCRLQNERPVNLQSPIGNLQSAKETALSLPILQQGQPPVPEMPDDPATLGRPLLGSP